MPAPKSKKKYCPICKKEVLMSSLRSSDSEDDLWWALCTSCESTFALTRRQFHREKRPRVSAINRDDARTYKMNQTYSEGELIYHRRFDDVGFVLGKEGPLNANCSGSIVVSFRNTGQKKLIEGYSG